MRIQRFFTHRCTLIKPGVVTGQDPYGKDIYGDEKHEGVPCRLDNIQRSTSRDEYGTDFVTRNMVFLPPDLQVKNNFRLSNFVDDKNNSVIEGEYEIEQVNPVYKRRRLNHYEVELKEGLGNG